jgi:hypothetical protein
MSFEPQNALEASLMKAAGDPAHRPQFCRDLLESQIYLIQPIPAESESDPDRVRVSQGESIQIGLMEKDGRPYLPIFTSLPRLQAMLSEPAGYIALSAKVFLEMTAGADLMLNPGSDYGKEITAAEAASLLDGSIWQPTESFVARKETSVMLGQPARYPDALAEALTRFFRTRPQVQRAWLAHYFNPEQDERPHTLIGIDFTGDPDALMAEAGVVASGVTVPDPPVDFTRFVDDGGLGQYFKDTEPFYQKRPFGLS